MDFKPFPKLARLNREIVITEKIDGTNAQVYIVPEQDYACPMYPEGYDRTKLLGSKDDFVMFAGSRTKWITPEKSNDNAGFAAWVKANAEELFQLGPGQHFGEWWGGKIQRGYGLAEKRFSLFNTSRWTSQSTPSCCHVVPVLYQGPFREHAIEDALLTLRVQGSVAAPGFKNSEGIVIYHTAANSMFKVTLDNDGVPKSLVA